MDGANTKPREEGSWERWGRMQWRVSQVRDGSIDRLVPTVAPSTIVLRLAACLLLVIAVRLVQQGEDKRSFRCCPLARNDRRRRSRDFAPHLSPIVSHSQALLETVALVVCDGRRSSERWETRRGPRFEKARCGRSNAKLTMTKIMSCCSSRQQKGRSNESQQC